MPRGACTHTNRQRQMHDTIHMGIHTHFSVHIILSIKPNSCPFLESVYFRLMCHCETSVQSHPLLNYLTDISGCYYTTRSNIWSVLRVIVARLYSACIVLMRCWNDRRWSKQKRGTKKTSQSLPRVTVRWGLAQTLPAHSRLLTPTRSLAICGYCSKTVMVKRSVSQPCTRLIRNV